MAIHKELKVRASSLLLRVSVLLNTHHPSSSKPIHHCILHPALLLPISISAQYIMVYFDNEKQTLLLNTSIIRKPSKNDRFFNESSVCLPDILRSLFYIV